jgi:hypothetical protein
MTLIGTNTLTMPPATVEAPTITDVLADIEKRLTALGDQGDVLNTVNAQAAWARDHSQLVNWRQTITTSVATLAQVTPKIAPDEKWEADLTACRATLDAELLAMPPRIRNERELYQQQNLTTSMRIIDFGKRGEGQWTRDLEQTKLGDLLRAAGYQEGPKIENQSVGPLPFYGSLSDVRGRLKALRAERDSAQRSLDNAIREATDAGV